MRLATKGGAECGVVVLHSLLVELSMIVVKRYVDCTMGFWIEYF